MSIQGENFTVTINGIEHQLNPDIADLQEFVKEFKLIYKDKNGKTWLFKRTKSPRTFIREDGEKFSHTFVRFNYEYIGRAYYRYPKKAVPNG